MPLLPQSAHEQCFLCRRARPERFVYYRDYNELEGARAPDLAPAPDLAAPAPVLALGGTAFCTTGGTTACCVCMLHGLYQPPGSLAAGLTCQTGLR
jgi:hypothetical protein